MLLPASPIQTYLWHPLQALGAVLFMAALWLMPLGMASGLGGWLGRTIGPGLGLTRRADRNLRHAFPEKTDAEIKAIIFQMWDNLGRTVCEFPHLSRMKVYGPGSTIEVSGVEHIDRLRDDGKPGIFVTGHFANWEVPGLTVYQRGLPLDLVYREANNRLLGWLFIKGRSGIKGNKIPKGAHGIRGIINCMKEGRHLGLLVDQKLNEGIPVPFFGRDAMTAPSVADMARRYDCPVVMSRVQRLKGTKLKVTIFPPMEFARTDDRAADTLENMTRINKVYEDWIRDDPGQWLWLHNRWPG